MEKSKKTIYILLSTLTIIVMLLIGAIYLFQLNPQKQPQVNGSEHSQNTMQTENSQSSTTEDGSQSTEDITTENATSTEETENTEDEEQTVVTPLPPLSYNEQVALDFVETPMKRTREEAILKIKELSRWYPALYFVYQNADLYPTELLLSGAGNPEMTDFMYGFLTTDGTVTGGFTDAEQPEDYPLFLQYDVRWGYSAYGSSGNLACTGCGPTCLSMAVFYLTGNRDCTPDAVAAYSLEHNHYIEVVGTAWALLNDYPAQFGLSSYQIKLREANLKAELDKGRVLICSVRPGDFTSSGHFIVIYGYDENGFKINDPKSVYRSRLSWTYEQIQDDIKATWTIGK